MDGQPADHTPDRLHSDDGDGALLIVAPTWGVVVTVNNATVVVSFIKGCIFTLTACGSFVHTCVRWFRPETSTLGQIAVGWFEAGKGEAGEDMAVNGPA